MLGDIRLLSVGRRSLSMDEKSMSGCSLTDEARQAAEAKLSPDGDGPRMYGARRIKSTSELEAGRPLGRQYLSPSTKAVGALAVPKSGGANDSDVLFVTILEVRRDYIQAQSVSCAHIRLFRAYSKLCLSNPQMSLTLLHLALIMFFADHVLKSLFHLRSLSAGLGPSSHAERKAHEFAEQPLV